MRLTFLFFFLSLFVWGSSRPIAFDVVCVCVCVCVHVDRLPRSRAVCAGCADHVTSTVGRTFHLPAGCRSLMSYFVAIYGLYLLCWLLMPSCFFCVFMQRCWQNRDCRDNAPAVSAHARRTVLIKYLPLCSALLCLSLLRRNCKDNMLLEQMYTAFAGLNLPKSNMPIATATAPAQPQPPLQPAVPTGLPASLLSALPQQMPAAAAAMPLMYGAPGGFGMAPAAAAGAVSDAPVVRDPRTRLRDEAAAAAAAKRLQGAACSAACGVLFCL